MSEKKEILKWVSRGKTIYKSDQHEGMFIVVHPDNTQHTINSDMKTMLKAHPPEETTEASMAYSKAPLRAGRRSVHGKN